MTNQEILLYSFKWLLVPYNIKREVVRLDVARAGFNMASFHGKAPNLREIIKPETEYIRQNKLKPRPHPPMNKKKSILPDNFEKSR